MHDLIERQAAIDAMGRATWAINRINELPSAQPERLTDDDFETIRIHLNAYKEKLCNQQRWKEADEYQRILDRFISFASAQPVAKDINVPTKDCISRKAAIDAVDEAWQRWDVTTIDQLRDKLNELLLVIPSEKPDLEEDEDIPMEYFENGGI